MFIPSVQVKLFVALPSTCKVLQVDKSHGHHTWLAGPRSCDFKGTTMLQGWRSQITGKSDLYQHHGAESYCLDVSRSSIWVPIEGLKPGRELAGLREPSQRNQQSRKCLVIQEPCQGARPQGREELRGGQDGKPNRR